MNSILSCPVCKGRLVREEKRYACSAGHSFDIARQGYVNLLVGKDAGNHGDNALMIAARTRFLSRGYYAPLAEALYAAILRHAPKRGVLLDIGCGEGYYTEYAARAMDAQGGSVFAFDISKDALKAASHRKCATLFAASAYTIPVQSESADVATLLFSPFCREEILRALKPSGIFLMAYPGERHLWGLKQALYDTPYLNRPEDTKIDGFALIEKINICARITLPDRESIEDLFKMTPYYYKTGEKDKAKLSLLSSLETEVAFHLCIYRKL